MENTGYSSEVDGKGKPAEKPRTNDARRNWSTPVGLAVVATSWDSIEEAFEATLDSQFLREGDIIGSECGFSIDEDDDKGASRVEIDSGRGTYSCYSSRHEQDKDAGEIFSRRPPREQIDLPQSRKAVGPLCECSFMGRCIQCIPGESCPVMANCSCPSDVNTRHQRIKKFKEEHAKKFMATLRLFSAEKQVEFDSAEHELRHVQNSLSRAMNESVYKVNSVADAMVAKINIEREMLIRRITEEGTLAITNMQAQRQFVEDLKRSLQHVDNETTTVLDKRLDHVVKKASFLTDKVRKIQVTQPIDQYTYPTVIDFEPNTNLGRISIGRLVEKPIDSHSAESQEDLEELDSKKQSAAKRRPILKFGNGFGRSSSIAIAYDVSVNRSGEFVAVAAGSSGIVCFSAHDGAFLFRFCGPEEERLLDARSVAHLSNGNILVVDGKCRDIKVFEPFGRYLNKFSTCSQTPSKEVKESKVRICSIAVDSDDIILVGDRRRKVITMHQINGAKIHKLATEIEPDFIAVSTKEIIAVSAVEEFEVQLMNYIGQFLLRIVTLPNGRSLWPKGVCFDEHSKYLYVAHYKSLGEKAIHKYNVVTGQYVDCVSKNLSGPNGISLCGFDKLVVADFGCVKIFSVDH